MKRWSTEMQVLNQQTKELHWVEGMVVIAPSKELAQKLLDKYDFHYLVLGDEIICEIPCKPETLEPDWNRMIDYEVIRDN
jgi:hypothetical protein